MNGPLGRNVPSHVAGVCSPVNGNVTAPHPRGRVTSVKAQAARFDPVTPITAPVLRQAGLPYIDRSCVC